MASVLIAEHPNAQKHGNMFIILLADTLAAPVISGLAVGAVLVILFALFNAIPIKCGAPGLQLAPRTEEERIRGADMIVYGTVLSAELQPVYYYEFGEIRTNLRYVVTIYVDRYILDKTGDGAKILTFREDGFGCAYLFKSEVSRDIPYAVEHERGEKAIFFIEKFEGPYLGKIENDWYSFGLFGKYAVVGEDDNGNKLFQSKWDGRMEKAPVTITAFESKVNGIIGGTAPHSRS